MRIYINGHGSISAAGDNPARSALTYRANAPTWGVDQETGLPIYRAATSAANPALTAFFQENKVDRASDFALRAAAQAIDAAGWAREKFAILVGCSRGPTESWEMEYDHFLADGEARPRTSPRTTLGGIGFALAAYFRRSALSSSLSVTCSSGFHALLHGVALLESGLADRVLVGGAEAPLTGFTLAQMRALRIYAGPVASHRHACRPFADPASGMAIGEGAAFFALSKENSDSDPAISGLSFAQERAVSATGISKDGAGLQQTMRAAAAQAASTPDLIVAHAPGTRRGDAAERTAIHQVFGESARAKTVSGKWATGHTFGASGPLGLALALGYLGAAAGARVGDVVVANEIGSALVNATGFGGNVVSVLVERGQG